MAVNRDLSALVPAFRERIEQHLQLMRDAGHKPRVHETLRSKVRSVLLILRGKSRARGGLSMHYYGVACDVICDDHLWSCDSHGCDFYAVQGAKAKVGGLTWGGDWDGDGDRKDQSFDDRPHLQAVKLGQQQLVRKMAADRLAVFVANKLARSEAA